MLMFCRIPKPKGLFIWCTVAALWLFWATSHGFFITKVVLASNCYPPGRFDTSVMSIAASGCAFLVICSFALCCRVTAIFTCEKSWTALWANTDAGVSESIVAGTALFLATGLCFFPLFFVFNNQTSEAPSGNDTTSVDAQNFYSENDTFVGHSSLEEDMLHHYGVAWLLVDKGQAVSVSLCIPIFLLSLLWLYWTTAESLCRTEQQAKMLTPELRAACAFTLCPIRSYLLFYFEVFLGISTVMCATKAALFASAFGVWACLTVEPFLLDVVFHMYVLTLHLFVRAKGKHQYFHVTHREFCLYTFCVFMLYALLLVSNMADLFDLTTKTPPGVSNEENEMSSSLEHGCGLELSLEQLKMCTYGTHFPYLFYVAGAARTFLWVLQCSLLAQLSGYARAHVFRCETALQAVLAPLQLMTAAQSSSSSEHQTAQLAAA